MFTLYLSEKDDEREQKAISRVSFLPYVCRTYRDVVQDDASISIESFDRRKSKKYILREKEKERERERESERER